MLGRGIVKNAVALGKDFGMGTYLNFQAAADDIVEFLAGMGGSVNRLILLFFGIFIAYPIGLGKFIAEFWGKIFYHNAVLVHCYLTVAAAHYLVGRKIGTAALNQIDHFNIKS